MRNNAVKAPIHIAMTGINIPALRTKIAPLKNNISPSSNISIGYIGAMDWMPNQEGVQWFLDNVWGTIKKRYPDVRFHLAGRGLKNDLFKQLPEGVILEGEVENADEFRLKHPIMVVPLLSGSGIRIKIIEGLAIGIPMVVSEVALEGISATHGEHLLIAKNADQFADQVSILIERPELRQILSRNAPLFAEQHLDQRVITTQLLGFYQYLISTYKK